MDYDEVLAALLDRWPENKIAPDLSRITMLCDILGNPQRTSPVIQVAGTNGKTSTARVIEAILRAAGLRTGMTTSPALIDVTDRIQLDAEPISRERFVQTYLEVAPYLDLVDVRSDVAMTMFEVLTGMAFACFADAPVDVAIVETGMGGRWDATSVADADVAVITPIGLDHTEYLGATIAEIAAEKAGIIKPDSVVVLASQRPAAADVLAAAATGHDIRDDFEIISRGLAVGGQVFAARLGETVHTDLFLPLHGRHQVDNAVVAMAAAEALIGPQTTDVFRRGFETVTSPGRMHVIGRHPLLIADAAHNPDGMAATMATMREEFRYERLVVVLAVLADKDVAGIARLVDAEEVIASQNSSPRCLPALDLATYTGGEVEPNLIRAIENARELAGPHGAVLVTGSVVTAGEAVAWARAQ